VKKIVIVGAGGRLGAALARQYSSRHEIIGFNHGQMDLGDLAQVRQLLSPFQFDLLINCAALTNVDYCESHRDEAWRVNTDAPQVLAEICRTKKARLVHISTDYVFDGNRRVPYFENDVAKPISVYGESKLEGEERVLDVGDEHLIVRASWVFGPDRPSFVDQVIARAQENAEVAAVADKFSTPTYTLELAQWLETVWETRLSGILHLANAGECSWQEYAQHAIDCCAAAGMTLKGTRVAALSLADMKNFVARRPPFTVLSTEKFTRLTGTKPRSWREAVADYVNTHVIRK
jgi:dTDP-4-dehydrorhamnose reductase